MRVKENDRFTKIMQKTCVKKPHFVNRFSLYENILI